ncbi:MAG: ankyrin repeat domain-containing protein, partial [Akkermansia sp.]|nr:ankyrin repeat domain-containing protein [Akkermansia sp.]
MKRSILTFWAWVCLAACPGVACAADQQQDGGRKNRQQVSKAEDQADSQFEDNRTSAERGQYVDAPDTGSEGTDSDTYKIFQAIVNHKADDLADLYEEAETGITPTRTGTDGKQQQQQAQPQTVAADPTAEPDESKKRDINSDVCFGSLTKDAQDSLKQRMDQRELLVRAHINKLGSLTPLALAAYYGDEKMVETLLDTGKASPEKTVLEKQTPLMLAAFGH